MGALSDRPIRVDGAMGTTLRARGLASDACADTWVMARPMEVLAVHQAFVEAGAQILRTATLCSRPDRDKAAMTTVRAAVALARRANPEQVWLSVGPAGPQRDASQLAALASTGADRVLLETFVDGAELLEAAQALVQAGARVVASMVPSSSGALLDGSPPPWKALLDVGVEGVGFNCGQGSADVVRAIRALPSGGPWFAAPVDDSALPDSAAELATRVRWLGGCCGVGPARWAALW